MTRADAIRGLFARRGDRRVFGFDAKGRGGPVKAAAGFPDSYTHGCVEGDLEWVKLPLPADRSACASCGAAILWAATGNGKAMPLDADPVPGGPFKIENALCVKVRAGDGTKRGTPRYKSHFSTCPDAESFRK